MKKLFLLIILTLASASGFAFQFLHVGTIESRHWNDGWDEFNYYSLHVYAGGSPDGTERTMIIKITSAIGDDYQKEFTIKKCSERQIKNDECGSTGYTKNQDFMNLVYILDKSIKWSKIAKENKVERVRKNISDSEGRIFYSPFGGGYARFFASNFGKQTDLILPVNFDIGNKTDRYYDIEAQEKFYRLLTKEVTETIERSKVESDKIDKLFK